MVSSSVLVGTLIYDGLASVDGVVIVFCQYCDK